MLLSSNEVPAEKLTVTESPTSYARLPALYYGTVSLTSIHEHNGCKKDHSRVTIASVLFHVLLNSNWRDKYSLNPGF